MHIVIAPNAFKNSLPATEAAQALKEGLELSRFRGTSTCMPVGDGGDGTGLLLRQYFNARYVPCTVKDPLGRPVDAGFGITPDGATAIIELADASGLRLLERGEYNPLLANTRGTGTLIKKALNAGVSKIILCIGGSATVDGGTAIMKELGVRFKDSVGTKIKDFPLGLAELQSIDCRKMDKRLSATEMVILCDVRNKLLGKNGAAAAFGPQKGARKEDIKFLEKCLGRLDQVLYDQTGLRISEQPHSGAAGGVAALLSVLAGAKAVDGAACFLRLAGFDALLNKADLVVTGEGSIDEQTLRGKAPGTIARAAKKKGIPVIGVAGTLPVNPGKTFEKYFDVLLNINPPGTRAATALLHTRKNLVKMGKRIGNMYA